MHPCTVVTVSRADLVRLLHLKAEGASNIELGDLCGYSHPDELKQKVEAKHVSETQTTDGESPDTTPADPEHIKRPRESSDTAVKKQMPHPQLGFWRVVQMEAHDEDEIPAEPLWLRSAAVLGEEELEPDVKRPAKPFPYLIPWPRLWPFLFKRLGKKLSGTDIDDAKLVRDISAAKAIKKLPLKQELRWPDEIHILVDTSNGMTSIIEDQLCVVTELNRICGRQRIRVFSFPWGLGTLDYFDGESNTPQTYEPRMNCQVLALSSLGAGEQDADTLNNLISLGRCCEALGIKPLALVPRPVDAWHTELFRFWNMVYWELGHRPRITTHYSKRMVQESKDEPNAGDDLFRALLSPLVAYDGILVRHIRALLPPSKSDIGVESDYASDRLNAKEYLHKLANNDLRPLVEKLLALLTWYRADSPELLCEEQLTIQQVVPDAVSAEDIETFYARLARTIQLQTWRNNYTPAEFIGYLRRWEHRIPGKAFQNDRVAACVALAHLDDDGVWNRENVPERLKLKDINWATKLGERREFRLVQRDGCLAAVGPADSETHGSPIASFTTRQSQIFIRLITDTLEQKKVWSLAEPAPVSLQDKHGNTSIVIEGDNCNLTLDQIPKPWWADEMGRDRDGLFIQLGDERYYWLAPGTFQHLNVESKEDVSAEMSQTILNQSNWLLESVYVEAARTKKVTPYWYMNAVVEDEFVAYRDFDIHGVTQRFRWIPPGEFLMGSPGSEPERIANEVQYMVELTKGFWLADTACTQELWTAVTGDNPSEFKGKHRPVENVNWHDCMRFIELINKENPGLNLSLPTEAQWEYACRANAKSNTPFSFGDNITPEQVNYNGNYPYAGDKKGKYREETVDVKSFPANRWGLYEMHGNVDEWCADWFGDYPTDKAVDPRGPDTGDARVLRGGSWYFLGRDCRSARRLRNHPDFRDNYVGFRLARGQIELRQVAEPNSEESEVAGTDTGGATSEPQGIGEKLGKLFRKKK